MKREFVFPGELHKVFYFATKNNMQLYGYCPGVASIEKKMDFLGVFLVSVSHSQTFQSPLRQFFYQMHQKSRFNEKLNLILSCGFPSRFSACVSTLPSTGFIGTCIHEPMNENAASILGEYKNP